MPPVQGWARRKRLEFFQPQLVSPGRILEIGSGSGWVREALSAAGHTHYTGVDLQPPADLVGDIHQWRTLGLQPESFDTIIAFEVVEHVDCFEACRQLLRPGGKLLLTTPVPHMDWLLKITEALGLNQRRTSPHDHLVDLTTVPGFRHKTIRIILGLGQWGCLRSRIRPGLRLTLKKDLLARRVFSRMCI